MGIALELDSDPAPRVGDDANVDPGNRSGADLMIGAAI
jgi:hypothetical protein